MLCKKSNLGEHNCIHDEDAAAICRGMFADKGILLQINGL